MRWCLVVTGEVIFYFLAACFALFFQQSNRTDYRTSPRLRALTNFRWVYSRPKNIGGSWVYENEYILLLKKGLGLVAWRGVAGRSAKKVYF